MEKPGERKRAPRGEKRKAPGEGAPDAVGSPAEPEDSPTVADAVAVGAGAEGLRERKRRETRAAIERAAISLVDELGYDNVTVAMISDRAVVSQGTFFNYFPTKDAAIVGLGLVNLDAEAVHAAYDRIEGTPYHATLALFLKVVRDLDWTSEIAAMRARAFRNPYNNRIEQYARRRVRRRRAKEATCPARTTIRSSASSWDPRATCPPWSRA